MTDSTDPSTQPHHRSHPVATWAAVGIGLVTLIADAPAQAADQTPAPKPPAQVIEIKGSANTDDRKDAIASKTVVTREDLERHGDRTVGQALARVPGVSVSGMGSQAREFSIRGLGAGYTQILVNGDPVPASFNIDSLSPDAIERIEVISSATADQATQAIAGSINIILRRAPSTARSVLKLGAGTYAGLGSASLGHEYGDRSGALTYGLTTNLVYDRDRWPSTVRLRVAPTPTAPGFAHDTDTIENGKRTTVNLLPRLGWRTGNDPSSLTYDGLFQWQQFDYFGSQQRVTLFGQPPTFTSDSFGILTHAVQTRNAVTWRGLLGEGARVELRGSLSTHRRVFDATFKGFQSTVQALDRTVYSELADTLGLVGSKVSFPWRESHAIAVGFDLQRGRRSESRIQRETSGTGFPTLDLDEDYSATVTRIAWFAQDEWDIAKHVVGYAGLRWEGLETETSGIGLAPVRQRSSVFSPVGQLILRSPVRQGDQVRIALGRTYKAPTGRDLVPRRWVVSDNGPASPNFQGNPALRPELAWSLDIGLERHQGEALFLGASGYWRRVSNVIVTTVFQDAGGMWVSTPDNLGVATVLGAQFEVKSKLNKLFAWAPDADARASANYNHSRVDAVPGPDNRLAQQPLYGFTLGLDHRLSPALTYGVSMQYERHVLSRLTNVTSSRVLDKRNVDLYALWRPAKAHQVRFSLSNALATDAGQRTLYDDGNVSQDRQLTIGTYRTLRVLYELPLR